MTNFVESVAGQTRKWLPAALALAGATFASSAALAQNCVTTQGGFVPNIPNIGQLAVPAGAASSALSGAIGSVNTIFLTQQGSAFVSAPANPTPDQPGGGVWGRVVGGSERVTSTSTSAGTVSNPAGPGGVINNSATTCSNSVRENFVGAQIGTDIARLNWAGWNVHLGTTAGYVGAQSTDNNGFGNHYEVPFVGTYLVATKGRFFADLMVRQEWYNVTMNNPGLGYFNQPVGAHGYSISTSAGYNFDLTNGWFAEPSAGFIYAKTSVDSFINPGTTALPIPGMINTNDVESEIGRLSLRVGRNIQSGNVNWQPFGSASVYHEFAGNVVTNYASLSNSSFNNCCAGPSPFTQTTQTSRIGTYGQYSLGVAGQVVNTGWLGFVRVDYRDGSNVQGWAGNAGIRYQFTPEMIAAVMPVKVKAPRAFIAPTDWTGFYVGGVAGVAAGRTDVDFVGAPFPVAGARPYTAGGLGGFEVGYNRQFSNKWVLGIEGDIVATNLNGARTSGFVDGLSPAGLSVGFSPQFYTSKDRTNWMSTVTGRVGYAWGRTLFYGKAGVAIEDDSVSVNCIYGATGQVLIQAAPPLFRSCLNQAGVVTPAMSTPWYTRVGGVVGFGTEFDLGHNWSAKSEYDFMAFNRHTARATDTTTLLTDKAYVSQVKIGVNYKFSPGAVVAKY